MIYNLGAQKVFEFDTENKVETNSCRCPIGVRSKVGLLQCMYCDEQRQKYVLLVRICKLGKIPSSIIVIFLDHSITLAGNNIYSDMKTLQKDYPKVVSALKTRGKHSITNIGLFARRRDIVYSGNVGL